MGYNKHYQSKDNFRNRLPFFFCHNIIAHHGYYFWRYNVYQTIYLRNHLENCFEQNYLKNRFYGFLFAFFHFFYTLFFKLPDVVCYLLWCVERSHNYSRCCEKRCYDDNNYVDFPQSSIRTFSSIMSSFVFFFSYVL